MRIVIPPGSLSELFDRARSHVTAEDLPPLLMNDPGHAEYVNAYTRVLKQGLTALLEDTGRGVPLLASFAITENLVLSHARATQSIIHRWFSILTACIELLGASTYTHAPLARTLATLLADTFALLADDVSDAPLDLVRAVSRDLKDAAKNPHERVLAILSELVASSTTETSVEAACRELSAHHEAFQNFYLADGSENPFYAPRGEFIWGAVVHRDELASWLALVEEHFPRAPQLANETRSRLLAEGKALLADAG